MKLRPRFHADSSTLPKRKEADGRAWCMLFPTGQWSRADFPEGQVDFNAQLFAQMIESWHEAKKPALPITFHHADPWGPAETKEAAGWIEELKADAEGLWGLVKWTADAAALIEADKYRYLSPEWSMASTDRRSGEPAGPWVFGAALLNDPFFHEMPRVAAQQQPTHPTQAAQAEEKPMSLKRINRALGLPEGAEEETAFTAVEKLVASTKASEEKLTAAAAKDVKLAAVEATVEALKASNTALESKVAKAEADMMARDVDGLIATALTEGKSMPDPMRETVKTVAAKLGLDEAKKLVASLPKVVTPGKEVGIPGDADDTKSSLQKFEAQVDAHVAKHGGSRVDAHLAVLAANPTNRKAV